VVGEERTAGDIFEFLLSAGVFVLVGRVVGHGVVP